MEKTIYYNNLYDLYGCLLTETQKNYFEDYYFNNLSFSEMASNYRVSRNAIFKQIHNVLDKLDYYESKLKLLNKKNKLFAVISSLSDSDMIEKIEKIILS